MSITRSSSPKQPLIQTEIATPSANVQSNVMVLSIRNCSKLPQTYVISQAESDAINALLLLGVSSPCPSQRMEQKIPTPTTSAILIPDELSAYNCPRVNEKKPEEIEEIRKFVLGCLKKRMFHRDIQRQTIQKYQAKIASSTISKWGKSGSLFSASKQKILERQKAILARKGDTIADIAKDVGVTVETTRKYLRDATKASEPTSGLAEGETKSLLKASPTEMENIKKFVFAQVQENTSHEKIKTMIKEMFHINISSRSISRWSQGARIKRLALIKEQVLKFKDEKNPTFIARQVNSTPASVRKWLIKHSEHDFQALAQEKAATSASLQFQGTQSSVPRIKKSSLPELSQEELSTFEDLREISKSRLANTRKRMCDYIDDGMTQSDARLQTMRDFKVLIKSKKSVSKWVADRNLKGLRRERIGEIKKYVMLMKDSMSLQELSTRVGISKNRIKLWIQVEDEKAKA